MTMHVYIITQQERYSQKENIDSVWDDKDAAQQYVNASNLHSPHNIYYMITKHKVTQKT